MSDDYLWDRSGPADPEIVRLEEMLRPLGHRGAPGDFPVASPVSDTRPPGARTLVARWIPIAAAAALLLALGAWLLLRAPAPAATPWQITRLEGSPTVAAARVEGERTLDVGEWLETNASAKAAISAGSVGQVEIEPGTRLRVRSTRAGDYRLQLARGTVRAVIWAPPGQFVVDTPSATTVDLGCAYTLTVDDDGSSVVSVTSGWVGFAWRGRESFVPAGAMCRTRPAVGPGTPRYEDASAAFHAAIERLDTGSPADASAALADVLALARDRDAFTLWHLLPRVRAADRDRVFDTLARFAAPPRGVTREGIRDARRDMLDAWWDALDLGSAAWWRQWEQRR